MRIYFEAIWFAVLLPIVQGVWYSVWWCLKIIGVLLLVVSFVAAIATWFGIEDKPELDWLMPYAGWVWAIVIILAVLLVMYVVVDDYVEKNR